MDKATLGWVLSMELIGMGLGSVLLGGVADKIGRRPTILGCLLAMSVGMFGASQAGGVASLLAWRLLTGLGIGGMLAAINAAVAELSSQRWRNLAVSLMVIGYPVGGVIGGTIVQRLLGGGTWHEVFIFGGWVTAGFIPLVWLLLPESVEFLDRQRKPGALQAINRILTRFGHEPTAALTPVTVESAQRSVVDIFKPGLIVATVLTTLGYFAHVTSFYFIIKWVPKLVVDMGFQPRAAAGVLTWANVGGASGVAIFGLIATRVGLKALTLQFCSAPRPWWCGSGAAPRISRRSRRRWPSPGCSSIRGSAGITCCSPRFSRRMCARPAPASQSVWAAGAPCSRPSSQGICSRRDSDCRPSPR